MDEKTKNLALGGVSIFVILTGWSTIKEHLVTRDEFNSVSQRVIEIQLANKENTEAIRRYTEENIKERQALEQRIIKQIESSGDRIIESLTSKIETMEDYNRNSISEVSRRHDQLGGQMIEWIRLLENRILSLEKGTSRYYPQKPTSPVN